MLPLMQFAVCWSTAGALIYDLDQMIKDVFFFNKQNNLSAFLRTYCWNSFIITYADIHFLTN